MQTLIPPLFTALWTSGTSDVTILHDFLYISAFMLPCCGYFLLSRICTWLQSSCQMLNTTGTSTLTRPLRRSGETLARYCHGQMLLCFAVVSSGLCVCVCVFFRLYLLYNHRLPQVLLYIFIILDLSLALFEEPAVIPLPSWVRPPCSANSSQLSVHTDGVLSLCVLGYHAGGAALPAGLHPSTGSLCQSYPSRQILERPQKHLHHRHCDGRQDDLHLQGQSPFSSLYF